MNELIVVAIAIALTLEIKLIIIYRLRVYLSIILNLINLLPVLYPFSKFILEMKQFFDVKFEITRKVNWEIMFNLTLF